MKKLILPILLWLYFSIIASMEIPLGSILYTSTPKATWSSSNSKFTLAFIPFSSNSSYVLSINYATVSVWQAGGANLVVDSRGHFCLHASGDLRLVTGSKSTIWSSGTSGRGVTHALLEDSGNFVLKNGSVSVWSSFDNPTDTLVPSQNLTVDTFLRNGIYSLYVTKSGDVVLNWNQSVEYWKLGSNISNITSNLISPSLSILPFGVLAISDKMLPSSPLKVIYSADYREGSGDNFRFLKLESDGNLRLYTYSKNGIIIKQWTALSDQCLVFGYCGEMGICSYNASGPSCRCPSQNFIPVDSNDPRKGCKRKLEIENCIEGTEMVQLEHTKFFTFGHGIPSLIFFKATSACRLNCLINPTCVASSSLSDGSVHCYMKQPGFLSGYSSPAFPGTSFVKVCGAVVPIPNSTFSKKTVPTWFLGVAILCTVSCLLLLELAVFCCCKKLRSYSAISSSTADALLQYASSSPVQFSFKELLKMTNRFSEKLGEGRFGTVYKGIFANKTIAVKKMEGLEYSAKHFRMDIAMLSSTHHLNLVKLIGFCLEGRHRLIVFEFMKNGSLASVLSDSEETSEKLLKWDTRFRIAIGAARGLSYLHESCRECIVHCNFKPENILLDENFDAKVSDFGLAKQYYSSPKGLANVPITPKTDVYSFDIVLLELATGQRCSETSSNMEFFERAYKDYEKGNVEGILDKRLMRNEGVEIEQVMRLIEVGFWCIHEEPSDRPTMGKVVQMLQGFEGILKPPAPINGGDSSGQVHVTNPSSSGYAPSPSFSFQVVDNFH